MSQTCETGEAPPPAPFQALALVDALARRGIISTRWVRAAFESTFRHHFVPPLFFLPQSKGPPTPHVYDRTAPTAEDLDRIYSGKAIITKVSADGATQVSLSEPAVNALVLESLHLSDNLRIMEIGGGHGFQAALLAGSQGTNKVFALEIDEESAVLAARTLAELYPQRSVTVAAVDGWSGVEGSQFDRVVVTATCPDISRAWLTQLVEDGRMYVPLATSSFKACVSLQKKEGRTKGRVLLPAYFLGIRGSHALKTGRRVPVSSFTTSGKDELKQDPIPPLQYMQQLAISMIGSCRGPGFFLADDDVLKSGDCLPGVQSVDPAGFAFLNSSAIVWSGHAGSRDLLVETLQKWEHLGRPGIHEFEVEVVDRASVDQTDESSFFMHLEDFSLRWVLKRLPRYAL